MGATIVVDALWGDSGKGKIAAYLAAKDSYALCIRAGTGTNAGHSLSMDGEQFIKTRQLPLAGLTGTQQLCVGSGVAVDPVVLAAEIEAYDALYGVKDRIRVDYRCPVITPEYKDREAASPHLTGTVGTTASGSGVALTEYRMRSAIRAGDHPALQEFACDVAALANTACREGAGVLIEGSQGTHLSLALTRDYPYCTSDNCTATAFADDVGLAWNHIEEVVLVLKAVPSRVGAGPLPGEMSIDEQDRRGIAEYGVTTGRRRRKSAEMPWDYVEEAVMLNSPTQIALTFCDHFDPGYINAEQPTASILRFVDEIEERTGTPVTILENGKSMGDIYERAAGDGAAIRTP